MNNQPCNSRQMNQQQQVNTNQNDNGFHTINFSRSSIGQAKGESKNKFYHFELLTQLKFGDQIQLPFNLELNQGRFEIQETIREGPRKVARGTYEEISDEKCFIVTKDNQGIHRADFISKRLNLNVEDIHINPLSSKFKRSKRINNNEDQNSQVQPIESQKVNQNSQRSVIEPERVNQNSQIPIIEREHHNNPRVRSKNNTAFNRPIIDYNSLIPTVNNNNGSLNNTVKKTTRRKPKNRKNRVLNYCDQDDVDKVDSTSKDFNNSSNNCIVIKDTIELIDDKNNCNQDHNNDIIVVSNEFNMTPKSSQINISANDNSNNQKEDGELSEEEDELNKQENINNESTKTDMINNLTVPLNDSIKTPLNNTNQVLSQSLKNEANPGIIISSPNHPIASDLSFEDEYPSQVKYNSRDLINATTWQHQYNNNQNNSEMHPPSDNHTRNIMNVTGLTTEESETYYSGSEKSEQKVDINAKVYLSSEDEK
ncbi:hypothetical protein K502DRAFT_363043 [Neoconidiobolus thromboides FSU 785]|nr:hypothetical protein K502DRAFT_363043 [Neoconidiobolus thromboides FSU 785]